MAYRKCSKKEAQRRREEAEQILLCIFQFPSVPEYCLSAPIIDLEGSEQQQGKWHNGAGRSHSCSCSKCSWRREEAEEIMYCIFHFPSVSDYSVFDTDVMMSDTILSQDQHCSCAEISVEGNHKCENQLDHLAIAQPSCAAPYELDDASDFPPLPIACAAPYNLDDAWDFPPLPGRAVF